MSKQSGNYLTTGSQNGGSLQNGSSATHGEERGSPNTAQGFPRTLLQNCRCERNRTLRTTFCPADPRFVFASLPRPTISTGDTIPAFLSCVIGSFAFSRTRKQWAMSSSTISQNQSLSLNSLARSPTHWPTASS